MNKLKMLPVICEDFEKMRNEDFYYVDKTKLIEQIIEQRNDVTLFTRPRRFGKSLNMSMLKHFFNIGTDPKLFDGLYISNNKELCDKYLGKYPVISITLKRVEDFNYEGAKYQFKKIIGTEADKFGFLLDSENLTEKEKDKYKAIVKEENGKYVMDDEVLSSSLQTLSYLLCKHYGKKTIILIDEYDVPLDKAFQNGYYKEMTSLIRGMFGDALKTNEYLEFAILTGCLRISKESIFTGLNNFNVLSVVDPWFDEEFGFTENEVKEMLKYYGLESCMPSIKEWYDGYRFGNAKIYCPWDVISHVQRLVKNPNIEPQNFWAGSSSNSLVKRFIDKADKNTRNEIETLVEGGSIEKKLYLELTYEDIDKKIDNIWSVLFTTGYLTLADKPKEGIYKLRIPNKEVREIFNSRIYEWFKEKIFSNTSDLQKFWYAIENKDTEVIEEYINRILNNTISLFDTKSINNEKEASYHNLLVGMLSGNGNWLVKSNIEAGNGFADIIVEPEDYRKGFVFELKYASDYKDMDNSCLKALKQIHDKRYYEYLLNENKKDILLYGISFYKKTCRVMVEKLDNNH